MASSLLSVFQLARLTPQFHMVICRFSPFQVLRDMKFLRDFIQRSHALKELHPTFAGNLFDAQILDTIFPYPQHTSLTEFCDTIRAFVAKIIAPVVFIFSGGIYRLRPRQLADWGFLYFPYYGKHIGRVVRFDRALFSRNPNGATPHLTLPWTRYIRTRDLQSVNVCLLDAFGTKKPFTLVTFAIDTERTVRFSRTLFCEGAIPSSDLAQIIPLITLPSLSTLCIGQDVDPIILYQFSSRHPMSECIEYEVKLGSEQGHGVARILAN
ncbi:hypothetical protein FB451DRAFT_1409461 [Mycena latifolia]|nr:hypothetical protein FB451DRAFT_1409461 [Mycena latifolia]